MTMKDKLSDNGEFHLRRLRELVDIIDAGFHYVELIPGESVPVLETIWRAREELAELEAEVMNARGRKHPWRRSVDPRLRTTKEPSI
jgi:hypothetical protein